MTDIDLSNPDNFNDGIPHSRFRELRREDPVYWHPPTEFDETGFWCITKYEDVKRISCDPENFSSWRGGSSMFTPEHDQLELTRMIMLNMDPPQHGKFRRIVSRGFTPRSIEQIAPRVRELARDIIDSVAQRGEAEFVTDIASKLPIEVICELMGVPPELRPSVFDLSNRLIGFDDPEYQSSLEDGSLAAAEIYAIAEEVGALKRKCPADDLTTKILHGEVDGENLSQQEYGSFFLLLALAGNETTRNLTSNAMLLLMEHPAERQTLVDEPGLIERGVEESLRYNPVVMHFRRTTTRDMELRGKTLKEGDKVVMWYPSANRDEDVFQDSDRFDVSREDNDHLALGVGEHFCLGASLARLQLNAIFEEILGRIPDMELTGDVRRLRSNFIDGIKEMPVRFTPSSNGRRL